MDHLEFTKVFETHIDSVYGYFFAHCNKSEHTAQDLTQDVFLKAWRFRNQFDPSRGQIRPWLFGIARNTLIDHYKKSATTRELPLSNTIEIKGEANISDDQILTGYLHTKMDLLETAEKDLLVMRYVNDMSLEEISELVGKSYDATKMAISRSLAKLKSHINAED